jgi:hypothetical protein
MKLQSLPFFLVVMMLSGCATTTVSICETESSSSNNNTATIVQSRSTSCIEEVDNVVIVRVIIDAKAEALPFERALQRKKIEGTAMLRTFECLKRAYPKLGNVSIPSKRLKNSFDDGSCCYFYDSLFKKSDILKRIK